jgi:hypothetical protein
MQMIAQRSKAYSPVMQRLLPLDKKWKDTVEKIPWPTSKIPQVAGSIMKLKC